VGPDDSKAADAKAAPRMISGASLSCRLLQARRASSRGRIRPSRRSCANLTTAAAKTRAAVPAPDRKCRGWTTVGLAAHLSVTTAGVSSASTSSIVIVSTAVMAPLASTMGMIWDGSSRASRP
jgi:hypothetical protein